MAKQKQDDLQLKTFKKTARELEVDESEEAFDRALKKVGRSKPEGTAKQRPKAMG